MLTKGQTNNPLGRPKGRTNKMTGELKNVVKDFLTGNINNFHRHFSNLSSEDYVKNYIALLKYSIPPLQAGREEVDFNDLTDAQLDYIVAALQTGQRPRVANLMAVNENATEIKAA